MFSRIVTTITQSKATQSEANLTASFMDLFKDPSVNTQKWRIVQNTNVSITQTEGDNLLFNIPAASASNALKSGALEFREDFDDGKDFRIATIVLRPVVTGDGRGVTGVSFSSAGAGDDEGATLRWNVQGSTSTVQFTVRGADGTVLHNKSMPLASNIAVLRLERINNEYRAFFKPGNDLTSDTRYTSLGRKELASIGEKGRIRLFAWSVRHNNAFSRVVGRFDEARISWETDTEANREAYGDSFSDGRIGATWSVSGTPGKHVYENPKDNLIMQVISGSYNGKSRVAYVKRNAPVIPENKDFTVHVKLYKPTVVGDGVGESGIVFVSTGSIDDESASIRWRVGQSVNRLVFVVTKPDGTWEEVKSVNVNANTTLMSLTLARVGMRYSASYKNGWDNDADWIHVGVHTDTANGAAGKWALRVSNGGAAGKFPTVVGRFDSVTGTVAK